MFMLVLEHFNTTPTALANSTHLLILHKPSGSSPTMPANIGTMLYFVKNCMHKPNIVIIQHWKRNAG